MSFEETIRQLFREELDRREAGMAQRIAALVRAELAGSANGDRLLGPAEIKQATGYSADAVKRWAREGKIKRYGTSRAFRVSERELRDYLAKRPAGPSVTSGTLGDAEILEMAKAKAARVAHG